MTRCKNLSVGRQGVLSTRYGSKLVSSFTALATVEYLFEAGGNRYEFGDQYSYYNETIIATGGQCDAPTFSPVAGSYAAAQTVTITASPSRAIIYYTLDGTEPTTADFLYNGPFLMPLDSFLIAVAIDTLGYLRDSSLTTGYYTDSGSHAIETTDSTDELLTEGSDQLMTEGL
jgi:hypothetical protein